MYTNFINYIFIDVGTFAVSRSKTNPQEICFYMIIFISEHHGAPLKYVIYRAYLDYV